MSPRAPRVDRVREVVTPEGVPLRLHLADAGDRASALLLDLMIMIAVLVVLVLAVFLSVGAVTDVGGGWVEAFAMLAAFFIRNFYFSFFEIRWHGRTPGKRMMKLRVIDARGGPLTAEALIARNLMREIEIFLPLSVLLVPEQLWPGVPGWAQVGASLWALALAFLPLFNRDRLRTGDMVGGTLVIRAPEAVLLPDMGQARPGGAAVLAAVAVPAAAAAVGAAYQFSAAQLDSYGIYELQVLEGVLRGADQVGNGAARQAVCDQIKTKIGWDRASWQVDPDVFLQDFYRALRAHLERKMLFGEKRQDKYFRGQESKR